MTASESRDGDGSTASLRISSQSFVPNLREVESEDLISSLPDEILQHILSFIPTKVAIRTSILSKQWRHVWKNTPSLSFDSYELDFDSVNKTLTRYTARKMMSFQLNFRTTGSTDDHNIDRLIKFAMSRDVENMWLNFRVLYNYYTIPDFFYINSSVKQITFKYLDMIPRCSVSWTSLKTLSCHSDDESIVKILSGCPMLESLTLSFIHQLEDLDLSKLLRLKKLDFGVFLNIWSQGPRKIVAPQIHSLRLTNPQFLCSLGDVPSLTEAKLDYYPLIFGELNVMSVQLKVVRMKSMLEKLQNVQKLTFGESFLQILSLVEFYKPLFPSLKVKDLTLETTISQYVIPSIVRLLQNSPELKKLTVQCVHTSKCFTTLGEDLDNYFAVVGKYPDDCWSSEAKVFGKIFTQNVKPESVASFMELMINCKTTKTLEKMVIKLEDYHLTKRGFHKLLQMVSVLTHDNNVSIFLSSTKPDKRNAHLYKI